MLPFLKNRRVQTMITGRKEEGKPMQLPAEHPLVPAMEDFARAHQSGDHHGMAKAFEAGHQIMNAMYNDEGESS